MVQHHTRTLQYTRNNPKKQTKKIYKKKRHGPPGLEGNRSSCLHKALTQNPLNTFGKSWTILLSNMSLSNMSLSNMTLIRWQLVSRCLANLCPHGFFVLSHFETLPRLNYKLLCFSNPRKLIMPRMLDSNLLFRVLPKELWAPAASNWQLQCEHGTSAVARGVPKHPTHLP